MKPLNNIISDNLEAAAEMARARLYAAATPEEIANRQAIQETAAQLDAEAARIITSEKLAGRYITKAEAAYRAQMAAENKANAKTRVAALDWPPVTDFTKPSKRTAGLLSDPRAATYKIAPADHAALWPVDFRAPQPVETPDPATTIPHTAIRAVENAIEALDERYHGMVKRDLIRVLNLLKTGEFS